MARYSFTIATAGHVDHGKTSLVNLLTGVDTDTLAEEKRRGLTINLGFAYKSFNLVDNATGETVTATLGFVDVPGHTDFINNMLAGVGAIDAVLLVVAADDGIMPQTKEHLAILSLLDVRHVVVALTKVDRVDTDRITAVRKDILELLATYQVKTPLLTGADDSAVPPATNLDYAAQIFPVSNISGDGIEALQTNLTSVATRLRPQLEQMRQRSSKDKYCRYLIDRAFTVKGMGTVITGSVWAGMLSDSTALVHSGSGEKVRIRGLRQDHSDVSQAHEGERVAANISLPLDSIKRGDWLIPEALHHPVYRFDAKLEFLASAGPSALKAGSSRTLATNREYHLYIAASHRVVNLRVLSEEHALVQIRCDLPLHIAKGDRFILRNPEASITLGGGEVLDTVVPRKGRSSPERLEELQAQQKPSADALQCLLQKKHSGINAELFARNHNCNEQRMNELIAANKDIALLKNEFNHQPLLLHKKYERDYQQSIVSVLETFHQKNPAQTGIAEAALSKLCQFSGSHVLFFGLLQSLLQSEVLKRTGTLLHLKDHVAQLSAEERVFQEKIRPLLLQHNPVPPRTRELAEMTGIDLKALQNILRVTRQNGSIVQVAENRHYLPEVILQLAALTEELAEQSNEDGRFSVIQFRDNSGIGRNLCIEILEYFDRVGFTRRDGNTRLVRTEKENIFG